MTPRQEFIRHNTKAALLVGLVLALIVAAALLTQGVTWGWTLLIVGVVCVSSWLVGNIGARISVPKDERRAGG